MKSLKILLFVALLVTVAGTGCTNVAPTPPTARQQLLANAIEDVVSVGLVPVLAKNPAYLTEARTVAAVLGSFSGTDLAPATVDNLLAKLAIAPEDARAIGGIVNAAWATYQRRYAEQVGQALRPDIKLFLTAVSRGIDNAITGLTPKS